MDKLTKEQEERICYLIGDWYLHIKDNFIDFETKTHRLGFYKEILKDMICNDVSFIEEMVVLTSKLIEKNS